MSDLFDSTSTDKELGVTVEEVEEYTPVHSMKSDFEEYYNRDMRATVITFTIFDRDLHIGTPSDIFYTLVRKLESKWRWNR